MKQINFLLIIGIIGVMLLAISTQDNRIPKYSDLKLTQIAGKKLFALKKCNDCHTLAAEAEGEKTPVTKKRDDAWFTEHVTKETPIVLRQAKSKRRERRILSDEIEALEAFLYQSTAKQKQRIDSMPENIFEGAYLAYQNNCLNCHSIAGTGKDVGPNLTYIADEHGDKEWLVQNLMNPQQFAPESPMPKFDGLPKEQLEKIAEYVLTLRK